MKNLNKFICIFLVFVFCSFVFAACKPDTTDATHPSETASEPVSEQVTIATASEPVTSESVQYSITLGDSYVPVKAYDAAGVEVSVYTVYGTSLRDYGGSLCFKEDGTFTTFIGAYGNINNESGKYMIISDTEIQMVYNNDKTEIAVVTQVDSVGVVTELRMPHRNFDVAFAME